MRCDFVAGNAKCWQSSHRVFVMILSPSLLKRSDTVCPLPYQRRGGIFGPSSALCDADRLNGSALCSQALEKLFDLNF